MLPPLSPAGNFDNQPRNFAIQPQTFPTPTTQPPRFQVSAALMRTFFLTLRRSVCNDLGGNRPTKTVAHGAGCTDIREYTEYSYDIYDENSGSKANRLTEYQVFAEPNGQPLRSANYEYDDFGNVIRIIKHESGSDVEKVTFMSYACNTLPWLIVDEDWYIDPEDCQRTKTREIRYDRGRRYMVQSNALNPPLYSNFDAVWTEFDGGSPARDVSIKNNNGTAVVTDTRLQQLGAWQHDSATAQTHFFHTDHLGTTQIMTNAAGQIVQYQSFTAFGEPADDWPFASLTQPTLPLSRYGFAGAHGYESLPPPHADNNFPYLHLGQRYYDPEIGRLLQRDPIGISGGLNTYVYANNVPQQLLDPGETTSQYAAIGVDVTLVALIISTVADVAFAPVQCMSAAEMQQIKHSNDIERALGLGLLGFGSLFGPAISEGVHLLRGPNQRALVELAKDAQRKGVSPANAHTPLEWAGEYGMKALNHIGGTPHWRGGTPHIHIGPVNHIPVVP